MSGGWQLILAFLALAVAVPAALIDWTRPYVQDDRRQALADEADHARAKRHGGRR